MNEGENIPEHSISLHTYPIREQRHVYKSRCEDLNENLEVYLFIGSLEGLEPYFAEASRKNKENHGNRIYMPCVTGERTHVELQRYDAGLLAPPGITEDSDLFVPGLFVPQMKISTCIGTSDSRKGYFLVSEYLSGQEFYALPFPMLRELESSKDVEFVGRIYEVHKDRRKRPRIWISNLNSKDNPEIFIQNREKLEELKNSTANFWWNMELDQSLPPSDPLSLIEY